MQSENLRLQAGKFILSRMAQYIRRFSAEEALRRLTEDVDSDEEDFAELDVILDNNEDNDVNEEDDDEEYSGPSITNYESTDGTSWTDSCPRPRARRRNIIRQRGGSKQFIQARVDSVSDIFHELFGHDVVEIIHKHTLEEARRQGDESFSLTQDEISAFLGLSIIRGVFKGRGEPLPSFWDSSYGRSIFRETMSRNKFQDILRYIRFDDKQTRTRRRRQDKFTPIRKVWDNVMNNLQKCFFPHGEVTIDEQLFPCRSRCSFIQYMPSKPSKFGIKFWLLCDVKTSYVLTAKPYVGKEERDGDSLPQHVVLQLMDPYRDSGLNVTTDNYFTSLRLAQKLLQINITLVGTVRGNRREIPQELRCNSSQPLHASRFLFTEEEGILMISYKAKAKKTVYLLSSMHDSKTVRHDDGKKRPEAILYYNSTKGGVDNADEMLRSYSTKAASRRWPLAAFFNLLDIVCLDSFIIAHDLGMVAGNRRNFLIQLGEILCAAERQRRASIYPPLSLTRLEQAQNPDLTENRRTSCRLCHKNKTRIYCYNCKKYVCGTCSENVCKECLQ